MYQGEKLTIETPEQIALEYSVAGIGSRFMALFYDSLIQLVVVLILIVIRLLIERDLLDFWPSAWTWSAAIYVFIAFCLYWGYFAAFEGLWNGQTPGKRSAKIRVIKNTGRPINGMEAIARNFMRAIDSIPGIYAVGCITMFIDLKNRRLGDLVAGTVVVHEREEDSSIFLDRKWTATTAAPTTENVASKLTVQELELIETFLSRRLDLDPEVRRQTAARIAASIALKLNVAPENRPADEEFLQTVSREYRDTARYQ